MTGRPFNLAVAFERSPYGGRAVAQSTFHHFADYNWDPAAGAPSFVSEPPGDWIQPNGRGAAPDPPLCDHLALWLVDQPPDRAARRAPG